MPQPRCTPGAIILTKTHLIAFYRRSFYSRDDDVTIVQAFVVTDCSTPSLADDAIDKLCLTHEAYMTGIFPSTFHLIRDSVIDTITRSTNLRFLVSSTDSGQTDFCCLDLTLPEPCSGEVTPLSILTQNLFIVDSGQSWSAPTFTGGSADGHARGFVGRLAGDDDLSLFASNVASIQKFTIDASQERCTAVLGEPTPVDQMPQINFHKASKFDGIRGRLCYDDPDSDDSSEVSDIMIFDLK
jgi:hypothetical protein